VREHNNCRAGFHLVEPGDEGGPGYPPRQSQQEKVVEGRGGYRATTHHANSTSAETGAPGIGPATGLDPQGKFHEVGAMASHDEWAAEYTGIKGHAWSQPVSMSCLRRAGAGVGGDSEGDGSRVLHVEVRTAGITTSEKTLKGWRRSSNSAIDEAKDGRGEQPLSRWATPVVEGGRGGRS